MHTRELALRPEFVSWTDGSCRDAYLGWGVALWRYVEPTLSTHWGGECLREAPAHGAERAEWLAATKGLSLIRAKKRPVLLLSDCQVGVDFINGVVDAAPTALERCFAQVGAKAFFELGRAVASFASLRALKVKGHAGSAGNVLVDGLATRGRTAQADNHDVVSAAALAHEVALLMESGSTAYSKSRGPVRAVKRTKAITPVCACVVQKTKRPQKLSSAQVFTLTRGITFELSALETKKLADQAAQLLDKARALPRTKPAQKTKRNKAIRRAEEYYNNTKKQLFNKGAKMPPTASLSYWLRTSLESRALITKRPWYKTRAAGKWFKNEFSGR